MHLEARARDAARVGGLARTEADAALPKYLPSGVGAGHVGPLGHELGAPLDQLFGLGLVDLVLRGAGQHHTGLRASPRLGLVVEGDAVGRELLEPPALLLLQIADGLDLFRAETPFGDQAAPGVTQRNHARPDLGRPLGGVQRHIAGTRDHDALALDRSARLFEHGAGEGNHAVAGRLGPPGQAAHGQGLAGQHAAGVLGDLQPLAVEEADLATAHADVARGHVGLRPDVAPQFAHEGLAEAHDLMVGPALGIEVAAALAAAHGQAGQGVLEALFVGEELERVLGHGRVEAQAALVGADEIRVLDPPAGVDLDGVLVIEPFDAEADDAVGDQQAFEHARVGVLRVFLDQRADRAPHFLDGGPEQRAGPDGVDDGGEVLAR